MDSCKSPTHTQYTEAVEGLYRQTWMASRDLAALLDDAPANTADARMKGWALLSKQHLINEVQERLAFGRSQLAEAEAAVDAHLTRGCRILTQTEAAS